MARVSTYLNFQGQAEEAFACYAKAFGTEVAMLSRYSDMPAAGPGELLAEERNLVMHAGRRDACLERSTPNICSGSAS